MTKPQSLFRVLYRELDRRSVLRVAGVYVVASWAAVQAADLLYEPLGFEASPIRAVMAIAFIGFPIVVGAAWFFNVTRDNAISDTGLTRAQSRFALLGSVAIGSTLLLFGGWFALRPTSATTAGAVSRDEPFSPNRVAVLYFDDLSTSASSNAYLANTLTETLIGELSKVQSLRVISSNGVRQFIGSSATPDSIARALEVGTLLTGSINGDGDSLRVRVMAVGADGAVIVSRQITVPDGRSFALVDGVVTEVENFLRKRIGEDMNLRAWRAGTSDPVAWDLLQRAAALQHTAQELMESGAPAAAVHALHSADSLAAQAEARDRDYLAATNMRAKLARRRAFLAFDPTQRSQTDMRAGLQEGVAHATRTLERDPRNAEALEIRGSLYLLETDVLSPDSERRMQLLSDAERDLRAAVMQDTMRATALSRLSSLLKDRGDYAEARVLGRKAYAADAYLSDAPSIIMQLFMTSFELGEDVEARRWCSEAELRKPGDVTVAFCKLLLLAWAPVDRPAIDDAWNAIRSMDASGNPPHIVAYMRPHFETLAAGVIARAGYPDSARAVLEHAKTYRSTDRELLHLEAGVRVQLNETDSAVVLLDRYLEDTPGARLIRESRRFAALPDITSRSTRR